VQNTYAMVKEIEALQRKLLGNPRNNREWWIIGAIFALQWALSRRGSLSPTLGLDTNEIMPIPVPFTSNPEGT
jgi:hypothetical protein